MQTNRLTTRSLAKTIDRFAEGLSIWQDRRRGRRTLMRLPERTLRDMGICRGQAVAEFEKPFWRD